MTIGVCGSVSMCEQNLGSQEAALCNTGCQRLYNDHGESSQIIDRPERRAYLDYLRE